MRIRAFKIIKYGPLREKGPFDLGPFNVFWGRNEAGKTLTIDALVKMLLGKGLKSFKKIQRVEETPEGYVEVEIARDKTVKVPEAGRLPDLTNLTPSDCRNIFIIRDSDLAISEEAQFYTNLTDRLTGLKTKQIQTLRDIIIDKAKITPTDLRFRNQKGENLAQRLEQAAQLLKEIEKLRQEIEEQKFESTEKELALCQRELDQTESRIQALELAQKRERFERASNALDGLRQKMAQFQALKQYNEQDYQKWRDLERDITRYEKERFNILQQLKQEERSLNALVQKGIAPAHEQEAKAKTLQRNIAIFGVLTALSLAGFFAASVAYLLIPVFAFGLACFYFAFVQTLVFRDAKKELEKRINQLQERVKNLRSQIEEKAREAEKAESSIEEIQQKSSIYSLKTYQEKLALRRAFKQQIDEKTAVLSHMFSSAGNDIQVWQKQVEFLSKYKGKAPAIKFSEAEFERLETKKSRLQIRIQQLQENSASFKEALADIARRATNVLKPEEPLLCETSVDLREGIERKINDFIQAKKQMRDNALKALGILGQIAEQEKSKVAELFGKGSLVSDYFSKVTSKKYQEAFFDQTKALIRVNTPEGEVLSADKLSGGAFDQLYMCVRLALGKKLLEGEKGFFILDDPFVKADPERLKHLLSILKKIAQLGWQVIYFSSKGEIKKALAKEIKSGAVKQFLLEQE